jgi:putative transposase
VGVDLGLNSYIVLSDGTKIDNPKYFRESQDRLAVLQRRAARKEKGSNRRRKANLTVARLHEHIHNQRSDFLHKLSSKLVRENQTIVIEDLHVAGMIRNRHLAKSIADASWSMFTGFLTYKCEWYGKNLITIGRFEPSTKTCHICGYVRKKMTLDVRAWTCPECKTRHDRDVNAAINVKKFGLHPGNLGKSALSRHAGGTVKREGHS